MNVLSDINKSFVVFVVVVVHSYRGAKLADLAATVSRHHSQKLNFVTIVAGFNDNSSTVLDFANDWRFLINLIIYVYSKCYYPHDHPLFINRKLIALNNSLFRLIKTFYVSKNTNFSPNLNVDFSVYMFCKYDSFFLFMALKFSVCCSLS